ncbi:probable LRR receptor-like serine/threonine-protein kinase At4g29180 [Nymphaea colorata]|nr:probable LRR receptor-like serine/threonine-protein kinase At4g29180 [Nymphaea colorata]
MAEISLRPVALLLFLALNLALASAGSLNVACGRSDSFTDSDGTSWTGDGTFATLGVPAVVNDTAGLPESLTHLRWFITRTCYYFDQITVGSSVNVTTNFYYGNFDGKDSPPQFQVQYDGNPEMTISTGSETVTYSLTYKALSATVNICFGVPIDDFTNTAFVNTIQVEGSGVNSVLLNSASNTALVISGKKKKGKAIIAVPVVIVIFLVVAGVTVFLLVSRQRNMARLAIQQGAYQGAGGQGAMGQSAASPYGQGFDGVQQNPQGVKPYPAGP